MIIRDTNPSGHCERISRESPRAKTMSADFVYMSVIFLLSSGKRVLCLVFVIISCFLYMPNNYYTISINLQVCGLGASGLLICIGDRCAGHLTLYLTLENVSYARQKKQAGMKLSPDQGLKSLFRRSVLPVCHRIAQHRTVSEAFAFGKSLHEQGRRWRPQP